MSRIPSIPVREWPPEMRAAMAPYRPPNPRHPFPPDDPSRPKGLSALGVFANHPALAEAYHHLIGHALFATTLTQRQRELLVLRVAYRRHAAYEWAQHAYLAGEVGITDDELDSIRTDNAAGDWDPLERAFLSAVDELVSEACLTEGTYRALQDHLDTKQLLDVVFTVGAYEVLAMALRTFEIDLDDDLKDYAWD